MKSAAVWFRAAAILLLLFAAGHTVGFLRFLPTAAEGRAVLHAMNTVHFIEGRGTYSYGEFYRGFGFWITVAQLFVAWLAWQLAGMSRRSPQDAQRIAWGLCGFQGIGLVLSVRYFSPPPVIFSALIAICLAMGALALRKKASSAGAAGA